MKSKQNEKECSCDDAPEPHIHHIPTSNWEERFRVKIAQLTKYKGFWIDKENLDDDLIVTFIHQVEQDARDDGYKKGHMDGQKWQQTTNKHLDISVEEVKKEERERVLKAVEDKIRCTCHMERYIDCNVEDWDKLLKSLSVTNKDI